MPLDAEGARRVYDRIGRVQDTQRFYEDPATHLLAQLASLHEARSAYELGCGTGRYAAWLLDTELQADASYFGVDVSPKMVRLAGERLARWAPRAEVEVVQPPARTLPGADESCDRFLGTYVFDLLSSNDAQALIEEAHRLLTPEGLIGAVSLTRGETRASRLVSGAWGTVASRWPTLVGGCRPIELGDLLDGGSWRVVHRQVVTAWGIPSEVLVASRRGTA